MRSKATQIHRTMEDLLKRYRRADAAGDNDGALGLDELIDLIRGTGLHMTGADTRKHLSKAHEISVWSCDVIRIAYTTPKRLISTVSHPVREGVHKDLFAEYLRIEKLEIITHIHPSAHNCFLVKLHTLQKSGHHFFAERLTYLQSGDPVSVGSLCLASWSNPCHGTVACT